MPRFSSIVTHVLATAILAMVAGSVRAQGDKKPTLEPQVSLEYHRVLVPHDRPDLWPTKNAKYIPLPEKEFQKLLKAANRGSVNRDSTKTSSPWPKAKITSADYEVRLETDSEMVHKVSKLARKQKQKPPVYLLSGRARLDVICPSGSTTDMSFLSLGPAVLGVNNVVWDKEKEPIETGVDRHGQLIAQVDHSGAIRFDFTARNRSTKPRELCFDLSLPRSIRSTVSLVLDPSWEVSVPSGLLLGCEVSKQKSSGSLKPIRWTVAPTLEGRLQLLLVKRKEASTLPAIPEVSESLVYKFSCRGLELRGAFRLDAKDGELPERLHVALEKPLTLVSAHLGEEPVKWFWESEEEGRTIVSLVLSEVSSRDATLRLEAACAIEENSAWKLPRIVPKNVFWRSGDITLLVTSPLSIGKLIPGGCIRTNVEGLPKHQGRSVELTSFRPDATATISLGWEKHLPTLRSRTIAELSSVGVTVDQTLLFTASSEEYFALSARVHPGWIIDSVESDPGRAIADWRVERSKKGSDTKLKIRLETALSKHGGPLRLKLSARRLESPVKKGLGLKDLMPVEFDDVYLDQKNQFVAVVAIDPYSVTYRGDTFVDPVTIDDWLTIDDWNPDQVGQFSKIPAGELFRDNARAARLKILLGRQRPVYAATVDMMATLTEKKLVESYRFRCEPEASHISRLFVHLSCNEGKGVLHFLSKPASPYFKGKRSGSDAAEKTFQTLSPKLFSATKMTTKAQRQAGMSSHGETWKITLKTPQNESFEIYAVRVSDYADLKDHRRRRSKSKGKALKSKKTKQESILPRTVCPSLAAMPRAVEHHASLQIETTDAMATWIDNQRLKPILLNLTDPRKIEKRRAAFEYETTDAMASSQYPSICLTVDRPGRNPLLVWQCDVQTAYGSDGMVKTIACYRLENQGASRLRLLMPKDAPPLNIIDVTLDGKYVEWVPEYEPIGMDRAKKKASRDTGPSPDTGTGFRLAAMSVDLSRTKRLPAVTLNYSYDNHSLGISNRHRLVTPRPDCEVLSVDWRLLVPPGYESSDHIAIQEGSVVQESSSNEDPPVLSPRQSFCWRTCLFGPIGRSTLARPFNPLSYDSWAELFDGVDSKAIGSESETTSQAKETPFFAKDYPDWNVYRFHAGTFDHLPSVRIVHRDSLEIFRWSAFLITIACVILPLSGRWVRRLPVAVIAAIAAVFLPSVLGCIASGIFMGVLVGLLAVWFLESGNGKAGVRRPDVPGGPAIMTGTTVRYAPSTTPGSTATQAVPLSRPTDQGNGAPDDDEREPSPSEDSTGTDIEIGKPIEDSKSIEENKPPVPAESDPKSESRPRPQSSPPQRSGGSTTIRRTTTLWLLAITLFVSGSVRGNDFMDDFPNPESYLEEPDVSNLDLDELDLFGEEKTSASRSGALPVHWPILVPTREKEGALSTGPMVYLPEPFFHSLERLADRQKPDRDRWLLEDLSLRTVLQRSPSDETIEPAFLFLSAEVSIFSEMVEVQLPLNQKEVRLDKSRSLLDGRPVVPRWSEDGTSLFLPIAGRGVHQIELTLVPLPESRATRWDETSRCDESGFRVTVPCFPKIQIELIHPTDMPSLKVDGSLRVTKKNPQATHAVLASAGHLAVWWPDHLSSKQPKAVPRVNELLLLDVMPNTVLLEATWSLTLQNGITAKQFRDMILSVDSQLARIELTDGFVLQSVPGYPEKRRLCWTRKTEPPSRIYAKFKLEKTCGIGQFLAPSLRLESGRVMRRWVAVRVAPNLKYDVQLPKNKKQPSRISRTVTPEQFMEAWNKMLFRESGSDLHSVAEIDRKQPDFVVDDRQEPEWSFRTEPKSVAPKVTRQTLRVSYGESSASVQFDAEWFSGSCDMPEPTLQVPENLRIHSISLVDGGVSESVSWSCTEEGVVHLVTGLLPPKPRKIQLEGTLDVPDNAKAVALPVIFLVGAEKVPVRLRVYRKPDAQVKLPKPWTLRTSTSSPQVSDDPLLGRLVQRLTVKPLDASKVEIAVSPNHPYLRARQVVTIKETSGQQEMVAAFEITPHRGVVDEIAIFVPRDVVGPFHTDPVLPLLRSHESEKGQTLVFRPKTAIKKRQVFRISSPVGGGEIHIPDVKLSGMDYLQRYVVLPTRTKRGEYRRWQTRLLNRMTRSKTLRNLMPIDPKSHIYFIVGRQWRAVASTAKATKPQSVVSLADIQVRWQEDGAYLGAAAFDLKPSGGRSCRLIVPEGLTILDIRIAGIPVSLSEIRPDKEKSVQAVVNHKPKDGPYREYEIRFASTTLPQRIEVLYRNVPGDSGPLFPGSTVRKKFQTPLLEVKTEKTRWTVQGPHAYEVVGDFDTLEKEEIFSAILQKEARGMISLTPFLTRQNSFGRPVRWTTDGFQGTWELVWESRLAGPTASQVPTVLVLLMITIFVLTRPIRITLQSVFYRHWPLFGMALGLFWWLFLSPSVLGWVIILAFLILVYRTRRFQAETDSTVIRIG